MFKHRSILDIRDLDLTDVNEVLAETSAIKKSKSKLNNTLAGKTVGLLFFEPSTRTKLSFELAAKKLGADTISLDLDNSSLKKGESFLDTIQTFANLTCDYLVIRHTQTNAATLAHNALPTLHILNGGDGKNQHPSQALLDAFTLKEEFGEIKGLKICIVGDILHSRVAKSNLYLLELLGAEISICAPNPLLPKFTKFKTYANIDEAVANNDVIMCLRLQNERMANGLIASKNEFFKYYGLKAKHLELFPKLKFMHPGPVNFGVELDINLQKHPNSLVNKQANNGLYTRMALLNLLSKVK